jgi:hypothetical protein
MLLIANQVNGFLYLILGIIGFICVICFLFGSYILTKYYSGNNKFNHFLGLILFFSFPIYMILSSLIFYYDFSVLIRDVLMFIFLFGFLYYSLIYLINKSHLFISSLFFALSLILPLLDDLIFVPIDNYNYLFEIFIFNLLFILFPFSIILMFNYVATKNRINYFVGLFLFFLFPLLGFLFTFDFSFLLMLILFCIIALIIINFDFLLNSMFSKKFNNKMIKLCKQTNAIQKFLLLIIVLIILIYILTLIFLTSKYESNQEYLYYSSLDILNNNKSLFNEQKLDYESITISLYNNYITHLILITLGFLISILLLFILYFNVNKK